MGFFNLIIMMFVGGIMLVGAGMTYHYRAAEEQLEIGEHSLPNVAVVSPTQFVKNVAELHASLPKWDDKNWKGLTYHPAGYYKKKNASASAPAPKQTAVR
ncbi:MAG: hypothetical protein QOF91_3736 [Alphaproteobacteria bacterium]|jgi:hypothetical protein|nr:hypothetical protein [Alphaproteobacteria bacterium]